MRSKGFSNSYDKKSFLMYRVELKVKLFDVIKMCLSFVPNVPCGVEREIQAIRMANSEVPNVPCGVERGVDVKFIGSQESS